MYTYKTEILTVSTKWFSDKANAEDILLLDKLINERASDGWRCTISPKRFFRRLC